MWTNPNDDGSSGTERSHVTSAPIRTLRLTPTLRMNHQAILHIMMLSMSSSQSMAALLQISMDKLQNFTITALLPEPCF
jgi:hypothetical protein